tara:strand:- start:10404 stop:11519 length:1116 start_codon:yes stop_codon:yes gene_type:complete
MAMTNFSELGLQEKIVWARDLWAQARNLSFVMNFSGKGSNAMIQRITELTKSEKGAKAIITLVADLEGDGVMGDSTLENNEEAIKAFDTEIKIDQLRNANRLRGRMADQKSVINFRNTSKDVLAYWLADRIDQLGFLTLSGVGYDYTTNGTLRPVNPAGQNFTDLDFASDVTAPTANRYYRWDSTVGTTGALVTAATNAVIAADLPSYEMLVQAKAVAKEKYIRGIKGPNGVEYYHVFMTPSGMAKLKLDSSYRSAVENAGQRGDSNPLFTGAVATVDGLIIHEYRHVFSSTTWGASSNVSGQAVLFCGAQALGLADLGLPEWKEETFDYGNQHGIAMGKICGFKKPKFTSIYEATATAEDFGVLRIDTAI